MCQPKRPQSAAQSQAQALADVDRIATAFYEGVRAQQLTWLPWRSMSEELRSYWRHVVTELLHRDVIRVGERPNVARPIAGQLTIEDA